MEKQLIIGIILSMLAPKITCNAQVGISSSDTLGCAPLSVGFSTSNQAASYLWFFGDGSSSTLQSPSHLYLNAGTYTVKLFVTNHDGSTDSTVSVNYISVLNRPIADFNVSDTSVCQNSEQITLQNNSLYATSYVWDFGDGVTSILENPTHSYVSSGNVSIKLIAMNNYGCSDIKTVNNALTILPQPTICFVAQNNVICQPQTDAYFFNLTGACTSQVWYFGDGTSSMQQNPIHTYTNVGDYNVSLIVEGLNGCIDTLTKLSFVSVVSETHSIITSNTLTGCLPLQVNFATVTGASYQWDFGNGTTSNVANPTVVYTSSGNYNVSVVITKTNGCVENVELDSVVHVAGPPQVGFVIVNDEGCAPLTSQFVNTSLNANSFQWVLGDGHFSTDSNVFNTYLNGGTYNVTLTAFNSLGCQASVTVPNAITVTSPAANFSAVSRTGCAPFTVSFNNTSTGSPISFFWDFGDGTTSNQINPVHVYSNWGVYTVKLIVSNSIGCTDTIIKTDYINVINPIGNYITPDTLVACAPYSLLLNGPTLGVSSWLWNFGDGTSSTQQNPSHVYTESGIYTVSLQLSVTNGCTRFYDRFKVIKISSVDVGFTYTLDCNNHTVSFLDTTSNIVSNTWNFLNGIISTDLNPTQVYSNNGNFSLLLSCTNADGCTATEAFINSVSFRTCIPDSTEGPGGEPLLGDSLLGDTLGNYEIVPPTYQLSGCAPYSVMFYYPFLIGNVVSWNFGDGTTSTEVNPTHVYYSQGLFTVELIYETSSGLLDTLIYENFIATNKPDAFFDMQLISDCINYGVNIHVESIGPYEYYWDFGDSTYSYLANPLHMYAGDNVNYNITLTVRDTVSGCAAVQSNSVFLSVNNNISASKYLACAGANVYFHFDENTYQSYLWEFGDGTSSSAQNPSHAYVTGGSYSVSLRVVDQFGCIRVFQLPQSIFIYKPEANFTYSRTNLCSAKQISFVNLSAPLDLGVGGGCIWTFGDGTTLITHDVSNVTHIYSNAGVYQVSLKVLTEGNCYEIMTQNVEVDDTRANFSMVQSRNCYPMTVNFVDQSINAVSWQWNFGNDSLSNLQSPTYYYDTPFVNPISLVITDPRGCHDSIAIFSPYIFTNPIQLNSDSFCLNSIIPFTSSQDSIQVMWDFGDSTYSTNLNPAHFYTESGNYQVTLISEDANGCVDTSKATIYVDSPTANFVASTLQGCAPLFVTFENNSHGAATFYWDLDDASASTAQLPSHIYTSPGVYSVGLIAINTFGCKDTLIKENYIIVDGPTASFHFEDDSVCVTESVNIELTYNNVAVWQWNFGDGTLFNGVQPQHEYLNEGNYVVSLFVRDSIGCSAIIVDSSLFVFKLPVAEFSLNDTISCIPAIITTTNMSNNATEFIWHSANSDFSTGQGASFVFNTEGSQTISLVALNSAGCSDTLLKSIHLLKTPHADFVAEQTFVCNNDVLNLINLSNDTLNSTYQWLVSPNIVSTECNPSFEVDAAGLHNVELIVTNGNGCADTLKKLDYVIISDSFPPEASEINLVSVVSDNSVSLMWTQSTCNDFYAYVIFRKCGSVNYAPIDTIIDMSITNYIDSGLNTLINSYCYKVQTIDRCGNKLTIEELNEHCTIELKANLLVNNTIKLTWNAYEGCSVAKYRIDRSDNNGASYVAIDSVSSNQLMFVDTTAYCPIKFVYKVIGVSVCGESYNTYSDSSAVVPRNIFSDIKVDIVRSTVVNNFSILTEWLQPEDVPGEIISYHLYRREIGQNFELIASLPFVQTSYVDSDVDVNSLRYEYKIAVVNKCGLGSTIGERGNSILLQAFKNSNSTELRWSPYTSWQDGVEYYIIERKIEDGDWEQVQLFNKDILEIVLEDNN